MNALNFELQGVNAAVEAGYVVFFHDKNNNRFSLEVLNSADEDIKLWEEYDLSDAVEEPSDFSLKDTETKPDIDLSSSQINPGRRNTLLFSTMGIPLPEKEEKKDSSCILF
jgi:hypothetical protein